MNKLKKERVLPLIRRALKEDIGRGDLTTEAIVPKDYTTSGVIYLKERGVLSGLQIAGWTFKELGDVKTKILVDEGVFISPQDIISFRGNARAILTGERVALNFLQRLSGISTYTRKFVEKVKGTGVSILDTRKTTPTLRYLEKYAVRVGGGVNHRMGLDDRVLIKENHIRIAGGIKQALSSIQGEIEVRNLKEVKEAIKNGATHLLLDNMSTSELKQTVLLTRDKDIDLECSGGVNIENVRGIAKTGVDYISIGAITHSYQSIDLSLILK